MLERVGADFTGPARRARSSRGGPSGHLPPRAGSLAERYSLDAWLADTLSTFGYQGNTYPYGGGGTVPLNLSGLTQTFDGVKIVEVAHTLPGYSGALRGCPPAFAAELVRALVISQTRFVFRNLPGHPRTPRRRWSNSNLALLEEPWQDATTADLILRMEWHAGLAGNAYVARRGDGALQVLRPDWCALVHRSKRQPDAAAYATDSELLGLVYANGGFASPASDEYDVFLPGDFIHWAPLPDPESAHIGMSWITPAVRDMQGDRAATEHKLKFFSQGATPNMVVTGLPPDSPEKFEEAVELLEAQHTGLANAYKTIYLSAGADATVVGSDLKQLDFKNTQGAGETRISFLSRVPAAILGIAEGLAGSSLNAGNLGMARRIFADSWVYPTLRSMAGSLAPLISIPSDSELWFDVTDVPLLREDAKDAAEITEIQARTITGLVKEGFTPETAKAAVVGGDMNLLEHLGLVSVQLQPPGGPADQPEESKQARSLAELIQKIYLGVGTVITQAEARTILNLAGASLTPAAGPAPPKPPAPFGGQPPPAAGSASDAPRATLRRLTPAEVVAAHHARRAAARRRELASLAEALAT
jgi:phage portal protein BeeE